MEKKIKLMLIKLTLTFFICSLNIPIISGQNHEKIATEVRGNSKICPHLNFVATSKYLSICNLSNTGNNTNVQNNNDKLLCDAINEALYRICHLITLNHMEKKIPNKLLIDFDKEILKLNKTKDMEYVCKNIPPFLENLKKLTESSPNILTLQKKFDRMEECFYTCVLEKQRHVLCLILLWTKDMYDLLSTKNNSNSDDMRTASVKVSNMLGEKKIVNEVRHYPSTPSLIPKNSKISSNSVKENNVEQISKPEQVKSDPIANKIQDLDMHANEDSKADENEKAENIAVIGESSDNMQKVKEPLKEKKEENYGDNNGSLLDSDIDHSVKDSQTTFNEEKLRSAYVGKDTGNEESHFFTYLSLLMLVCICFYVSLHNKQKILAILLEGRRSRRGRGSRRRPSTANYRRLDSNLEEAVSSECKTSMSQVIY